MTIADKLHRITIKNNSLVSVGLDSDVNKLPSFLKNNEHPQFEFNKAIIDATHDLVCAYKPNAAFYEARGEKGMRELKMTFDYLAKKYPEVVTIFDAKRGDIGNTNEGYVSFIFDYLGADAVTLHPYLGREALKPFLERKDKACILMCRNSNSGAGEFQDLMVGEDQQVPLYVYVGKRIKEQWNYNKNCMLVVGATYPKELAEVRKIAGEMTLLVPGIGAQGGEVENTVRAGLNSQKAGMIINSSRGIIFASDAKDFAEKARMEAKKMRDEINLYR